MRKEKKEIFISRDNDKRVICKQLLKDECKMNDKDCQFSHDTANYPCKYMNTTQCPNISKCKFSHKNNLDQE